MLTFEWYDVDQRVTFSNLNLTLSTTREDEISSKEGVVVGDTWVYD